jgi:hypothetical protein
VFQAGSFASKQIPEQEHPMGKIFDAVKLFFEGEKWPFVQLGDQTILQLGFESETNEWNCYARIIEEDDQFVFYSLCPEKVPQARLTPVAEYITRANYNLVMGNFEMDFDDGEVRFKTSVDVEGSQIDAGLIRNVVYANVFIMDRYLPGLLTVIETNQSAAGVIRAIE